MEDKNLRKKLSENARKTIEEKFSLEKVVSREIEVYNRLLD
jgi:glycosyltransferase involved in cell wall biosynthesis